MNDVAERTHQPHEAAQPSQGRPPLTPVAAPFTMTRGFFAVEPAVLRRAVAHAGYGSSGSDLDLSNAPTHAFAAFAGGGLFAARLAAELRHELWFLGAFPSWVAPALLVPLGADEHLAHALVEGSALSDRPDMVSHPVPPAIGLLDQDLAPEWRAMLRSAVSAYGSRVDDAGFMQSLAWAAGFQPGDNADCAVYSVLAGLSAVVAFVEDRHEVLVGGPA